MGEAPSEDGEPSGGIPRGRGCRGVGINRVSKRDVVPDASPWPRNVGVLDFSGGENFGRCSIGDAQRGLALSFRKPRIRGSAFAR